VRLHTNQVDLGNDAIKTMRSLIPISDISDISDFCDVYLKLKSRAFV
jgi:hypothetical protein